MSYTKGKWQVYDGPQDKRELTVVCIDQTGQLIEVADCGSSEVCPEGRTANARLIAAAPDLLEACEMWMNFNSEFRANTPMPDPILRENFRKRGEELTKKAIAKAEGR